MRGDRLRETNGGGMLSLSIFGEDTLSSYVYWGFISYDFRGCPKRSSNWHYVIPAKAGIQIFRCFPDPDFRRGDEIEAIIRHALKS
jgi:hypothetical protein